jgi:Family of unknown function (DUF6624)
MLRVYAGETVLRAAAVVLAVSALAVTQEASSPAAREAERKTARARVDELITSLKAITAANPALAGELREIRDDDQRLRLEGMRLWNEKGVDAPEAKAVWDKQNVLDLRNQARLEVLIAKHGWPGARLAGLAGAETAFLVVDHAPHEYQKKYLPSLKKAVDARDAVPAWAAMLEDRVRMGDGLPQRYGTQVHREPGWTEWRLYKIEDESRVDDRRAAVGLGPLAEYLKEFGMKYTPR